MSAPRDITTDDVVQRLSRLEANAWTPPEPPPLRLDFGGSAAPTAPRYAAWGERLRRGITLRPPMAAALASALLLAGLGGGLLVGSGPTAPAPVPAQEVKLAALPGAPNATAVAAMGGDLDGMQLKVNGLPASKPGEYYELWALNSPEDLAPIGSFRVGSDGNAEVRFSLGIDPGRYQALDISVEREDGNPGHSGDSLLRAPVTA